MRDGQRPHAQIAKGLEEFNALLATDMGENGRFAERVEAHKLIAGLDTSAPTARMIMEFHKKATLCLVAAVVAREDFSVTNVEEVELYDTEHNLGYEHADVLFL
jgi:hypothetical protein